jgi:predicted transcriptional regulator
MAAQTQVKLEMEKEKVVFSKADLIIKDLFGLTKKQAECFKKIQNINKAGVCISYLGEHMGDVDRSVVQKQVKVLYDKGLINRKQVTLAEFREICEKDKNQQTSTTDRGYLYLYEPFSKEELLRKANSKMNSWRKTLESAFKPL